MKSKSLNWFLQLQPDTSVCFYHQLLVLMGNRLWVCSCCSLGVRRGRSSTANLSRCPSSPTCPGWDSQLRVSSPKKQVSAPVGGGNTSCVSFWVPQEPRAMWIQTGWSGCLTVAWVTRGRPSATPERRAKVNLTTTGWSECMRTLSNSGESRLFSPLEWLNTLLINI